MLLKHFWEKPPKRSVDFVKGFAVHGQLANKTMNGHTSKHAVAGAPAGVSDGLATKVRVEEELGGRVKVAEEDVVLVHCQRSLHPRRQDARSLQANFHHYRIGHQLIV